MVSGRGTSSVTRVAPAASADSIPPPRPPTQKNGIGRYRRVSAVIQRAASPDRTAPSALACECTTPLGAPLLPEVKTMTRGSAAVTVSVMASTIRRARSPAVAWASRSATQTCCKAGSSARSTDSRSSRYRCPRNSCTPIKNCTAAIRSCAISSPAGSRVLNGTSTAPIRVTAIASCTHSALLGMISPTRVPLPAPASTRAAAKALVVVSSSL